MQAVGWPLPSYADLTVTSHLRMEGQTTADTGETDAALEACLLKWLLSGAPVRIAVASRGEEHFSELCFREQQKSSSEKGEWAREALGKTQLVWCRQGETKCCDHSHYLEWDIAHRLKSPRVCQALREKWGVCF